MTDPHKDIHVIRIFISRLRVAYSVNTIRLSFEQHRLQPIYIYSLWSVLVVNSERY